MQTTRIFLIFTILTLILGCAKDESYMLSTSVDPSLKGSGCFASVINYDERDTLLLPFPVILPDYCFQEPVMLTLYDVRSKGHINVTPSCRFNDHATLEIHITGVGSFTGSLYDSFTAINHHYIGSINGQGAQVERENTITIFTNLSTGETFSMSETLRQTINANGDVTLDTVIFHPCQ